MLRGLLRRPARHPAAPPRPAAAPLPPLPGPVPLLPDPAEGDALLRLLLALCWRRGVLLCWNDAPRVSRIALLALAAGARRVHAAFPDPVEGAGATLEREAAMLGLEALAPLLRGADAGPLPLRPLDCDARPGLWLRAGLDWPDLREAAGHPAVVADGSQLVHWRDAPGRLRRLRDTGARHLILETPVVEATPALLRAGFRPGDCWHAEAMTPPQHEALAAHWRERGVELPQFRLFPRGFAHEEAVRAGLGAVAWRSVTDRVGLARLLQDAGFRARRVQPVWNGRSLVVAAERR